MITAQALRSALEDAVSESEDAEAGGSKAVFLDALRDRLQRTVPGGLLSNQILMLLIRSSEFPLQHSRLDASDLRRRMEFSDWKKRDGSIHSIVDLVWEAITVSAGDCNECMGEEMVYLWDVDTHSLARRCDLCGYTLDLKGAGIASSRRLEVPTLNQLEAAGVIATQ